MPPIPANAEEVAVYTWADGWRVVRPLTKVHAHRGLQRLWDRIYTKPWKNNPWEPGGRRTHWMWPTDTDGTEKIYNELRVLDRTVRAGICPVQPALFFLVDPNGNVQAAMRFNALLEPISDTQRAWTPKLAAVLSSDGSRVVDPGIQGRLLDFIFGFVYAPFFGDSLEISSCIVDGPEWGLSLPVSWMKESFDPLLSSPQRMAFEAAIPIISDPYDDRRRQVMLSTVPSYIHQAGRALNEDRPRMRPLPHRTDLYTLVYSKKLSVWASAPDSIRLVIAFTASDARNWRWKIGWETDELHNVRWVAEGQDLPDLLVTTGLVSNEERYWKLIEDRMIEGAPTFDPDVLEPYELLKALPPLFADLESFRTWWEAL